MSKGFKLYLIIMAFVILYPLKYKYSGIDKRIEPYSDKLYELTNIKLEQAGFGIPLGNSEVVAQCNVLYKTITIRKRYWDKQSEKNKILILGHESLHCLRGAEHLKDYGKGMCPKSIMYPQNPGKWCSQAYFNQYIKEIKEWK